MSKDVPKNNLISKLVGLFTADFKSKSDIKDILKLAKKRDLITADTHEMMKGVMKISELKVRDIMIPRAQIITVEIGLCIDDILEILTASGHSRFPVVTTAKDNVEGILLAKDLLQHKGNYDNFDLLSIIRPTVVVPESKKIDILLKEFRSQRYHMAMVVDEYGGISGLITIEDILEEIVGEIEDEFDYEEHDVVKIRKVGKNACLISALTTIKDFNDEFNTKFNDDEFDTIGGLVSNAFGHLPSNDEKIIIDNVEFKVISSDSRRLLQLRVKINNINE